MRTIATLLSSAALLTAGSALAADLPSKKAAPVEYVRVCSAHGAGFFYIPGSDTCIRLGGRVRAEFLGNETWSRNQEAIGFRARARLDVDARNSTEYGLLRAFARYEFTVSNGAYGASIPAIDANVTNNNNVSSNLDKAFVQLGGLTAGRAASFYDFYAAALNWGGTSLGSDRSSTNLLAYTATFGSGFSATLSLEDPNTTAVVASNYVAAGDSMPDIVANLRVDQGWGSAQLSAAVHQIRPAYGANYTSGGSDYGWAVQGGVKINLPMIAAGDTFWAQAAYAQGAMSYIGIGNALTVGTLRYSVSDAFFANNSLEMTTGYSLTAGMLHYWTPTIRQSVFGNYTQIDPTGAASTNIALASKADFVQVGSNLIWSPIKGLDIGAEVMWFNLEGSKNVASQKAGAAPLNSDSGWQYRIRVQRDF